MLKERLCQTRFSSRHLCLDFLYDMRLMLPILSCSTSFMSCLGQVVCLGSFGNIFIMSRRVYFKS